MSKFVTIETGIGDTVVINTANISNLSIYQGKVCLFMIGDDDSEYFTTKFSEYKDFFDHIGVPLEGRHK